MYQLITLVGNLGTDPELRYTPSGVPVANFRLAVNKRWTGNDGQRQEKTTWFRVTTWRKQAEVCAQHLAKGRQVMIVGEVDEARPWTDNEGNQRASLEVTAQNVTFLGNRGDAPMDMEGAPTAAQQAPSGASANEAVGEEDIPF